MQKVALGVCFSQQGCRSTKPESYLITDSLPLQFQYWQGKLQKKKKKSIFPRGIQLKEMKGKK